MIVSVSVMVVIIPFFCILNHLTLISARRVVIDLDIPRFVRLVVVLLLLFSLFL